MWRRVTPARRMKAGMTVLWRGLACVAAFMGTTAAAKAQASPPDSVSSTTTPADSTVTPADSVYERARQLVQRGDGSAGRVLVDSMVAATPPGTPAYAEALYWRAVLAATSDDAERDYRRVIVEYPLSRRTGDALLRLAELETARGDRRSALTHLERFLIENAGSPERARTGLAFVRLAFAQNELQVGCTFLGRLLQEVPAAEVERRNQLEYYSPRCAGVDTTHVVEVATDSAAGGGGRTARDSTSSKSARSAAKTKARYTIQVAAYAVRADAEALVQRLRKLDLDARVVGAKKPFRVRIGRYATRAAATKVARELRAKKIDAFVTEAGADDT